MRDRKKPWSKYVVRVIGHRMVQQSCREMCACKRDVKVVEDVMDKVSNMWNVPKRRGRGASNTS